MLSKGLTLALAVCCALSMAVCAFAEEPADLVLQNGVIYTVDKDFSVASAAAIKAGKFVYVGNDEGVKPFVGPNTKTVDLGGKAVVPGIIESHMHVSLLGEELQKLDAFLKPKQEILDAVKAAAEGAKEGQWIVGGGWNQEKWDPAVMPTKEDLDAVAPNVPVVLNRVCGHATWANSKALELAGITKETPNPAGGEIQKNDKGELSGILTETAQDIVYAKIPPLTEEQKVAALLAAQKMLLGLGITTACEMGTAMETFDLYKKLYEKGDLKVRLYTFGSSGSYGESAADVYAKFYAMGPQIGLYDNRLTLRGIKLFADGSLGARSAWLLQEYTDQPGSFGTPRYKDEELYELVLAARKAGFQVATHAIGDAANRQVLNAYEKVLAEVPEPKDARLRIEHAQVVAVEDIPRFAKLGVIPSMESVHATSDKLMAEKRLDPERLKGAYAWRKHIQAGSILPNGSDSPVELVNPYHGLYAAVTRMDRDGQPDGGWYPEEKMTREEALKSFTIWGAFAAFEDGLKGSIETGKLADCVVLDRDPMKCPEGELKDILPLTTIIGGEVVYEKQ